MSGNIMAEPWWQRDYFRGYRAHKPHPMMTSTGSEGRCDICGRSATRDHDQPHERITYQEWLDEQAAERWAMTGDRPVRPQFAWERAEPLGEGRAGNYLAELKRNPPTFKANNYLVQAAAAAGMEVPEFMQMPKSFRFPFYYGSGPEKIKEVLSMQKYTLTVEAVNLLTLTKVIQAVNGVYGAVVEDAQPVVPASPRQADIEVDLVSAPDLGLSEDVFTRVVKVDTASIVRYLEDVCAINSSNPEAEVEVEVVYVAAGTEERSTRTVMPIRLRGNTLTLIDGDKGVKTFLVNRIESVEGPGAP